LTVGRRTFYASNDQPMAHTRLGLKMLLSLPARQRGEHFLVFQDRLIECAPRFRVGWEAVPYDLLVEAAALDRKHLPVDRSFLAFTLGSGRSE
jgi:hypothetical protein